MQAQGACIGLIPNPLYYHLCPFHGHYFDNHESNIYYVQWEYKYYTKTHRANELILHC